MKDYFTWSCRGIDLVKHAFRCVVCYIFSFLFCVDFDTIDVKFVVEPGFKFSGIIS